LLACWSKEKQKVAISKEANVLSCLSQEAKMLTCASSKVSKIFKKQELPS